MRGKQSLILRALREAAERWSSTTAAAPRQTAATVPAEVAHLVSRRHIGMVDMPPEMKAALDTFILGSGLRGRRLRLIGRRLTDHLKAISQTNVRGGILGWTAVESRKKQEKRVKELRQQRHDLRRLMASSPNRRAALNPALGHDALLSEDSVANSVNALVVSNQHRGYLQQPHHGSFVEPHRTKPGVIQEVPVLDYEELTAAAYAATRLPGCFAAAVRVFDELKARMPEDFKPKKMLDLGAGPGTAIWAAQEVWEEYPQEVLAIEPSWPMVGLAQQLEASRRESGAMAACRVRWMSQLPSLHGSNSRQKRRYDLVVASYVLSEVPEESDRWRMVRDLWERTGDVLVLIEPGTPVGSANIQEARTLILQQERKKVKKQLDSLTCTNGMVMDVVDPIAAHRLEQAGCHIVAPCPHDGVCPMANKKMWCHFQQRFLRTRAQKVTKIVPGHPWGPRDFQDERFSYVVFRRGRRKGQDAHTMMDVRVEESFIIPPDDLQMELTPGQHPGWRHAEAGPQTSKSAVEDENGLMGSQGTKDIEGEGLLSPPPQMPLGLDLASLDENTRALILHSIMGDSIKGDQDGQHGVMDVSQLEDLVSSLQGSENTDLGDEEPESGSKKEGLEITNGRELEETEKGDERSHPGLRTDRLQGVARSGLDSDPDALGARSGEIQSSTEEPSGLGAFGGSGGMDGHPDQNVEDGTASTSGALMPAGRSDAADTSGALKSAAELGVVDGRNVDWEEVAPETVSATKAASRRWSRIIRPPKKRSGHVILDVCVAAGDESGEPVGGKLQRHIVSRADKGTSIGPAGYKIAMKSSWGDLWPTYYNTNYKIRDL